MNMESKEKTFLANLPQMYYLLEDALGKENIFQNFMHFYSKEDIYERNVTFEVDLYAPDYIAFADDNGDMLYLISKYEDTAIYMVDLGDLNVDSTCKVADSVVDFMNRFSEINGCDDSAKYCSIIWNDLNQNTFTAKSILKIKRALKLSDSVGKILAMSKKLPQTMKDGLTILAAEKMLANLGDLAFMFEIIEK